MNDDATKRTDREREAERETRNEGLQHEAERLHRADRRPPHDAGEQDGPEQERPVTPQEEAGQDIASLENPPQAEGPRERGNNAV